MKKIIHLIAAARPNFMKIAPIYHALKKTEEFEPVVVWMLQHESDAMSGDLLKAFDIPNEAIIRRDVGRGSHAEQTGSAMFHYENVLNLNPCPAAVVVPGDVNTSMACALVAAKRDLPVVHLEAGLRSWDRSMPEEINRMVIDSVSELLLTPSVDASENLEREGHSLDAIEMVGNIMIDAFEMMRPKIEAAGRLFDGKYAVVTLHRPSNVDDPATLEMLLKYVGELSRKLPVIFPAHPRTRHRMLSYGIRVNSLVHLCDPMPYAEFMALVKNATIVITDSGGVQEETSYLNVPCATVRENTERPITCYLGTNELIPASHILTAGSIALAGNWKSANKIPLWDGHAADRCVVALRQFLS